MCTPKLGVQEYYDSIATMTWQQLSDGIDELNEIKSLRSLTEKEEACLTYMMERISF